MNFDLAALTFYVANPGFIIGQSLIGVDFLGGAGADTPLGGDFTSMSISSPTTVESGLFVHREVETCQLTATLPAMVDLENQWIAVKYQATEVYRGRVIDARWSVAVEVGAAYKPGNTTTKTYRVTLVATNSEDDLAGMSTPPRAFTNETLAQRVTSWTGLAVTTQAAAVDIPVNWTNAALDTAAVRRIYRATDQLGSLLDTLRAEARLRNMTFIYQPYAVQPFILKPNNEWLVGDLEADSLVFTDDPTHTAGQATDPSDDFVHLGRYVGYGTETIGRDAAVFMNAATIRWGQYDVESPPGDGNPVETVFGPYRASGANARDTTIDAGTLDISSPGSNPYWFSRAIASITPLKSLVGRFTQEVTAPLQSIQQLEGTVPGMALLEHDGVVERVAVLGRTHQVTTSKWLVRYVLGPPHLLDRLSDYDPGTPEVHAPVAGGGAGDWTFEWVVPEYPTDAAIYEVQFSAPVSSRLITSDQALIGIPHSVVVAPAPGTVRTWSIVGPATGDGFWVLYTSNPAPGTTNPAAAWREGPPGFLGASL
ncbi:MAG TPA: hypothetical protein VIQ30_10995 [Pseudonocardia sp.]